MFTYFEFIFRLKKRLNRLIKSESRLVLFLLFTFITAIFFRTYVYLDRIYFLADSTLFVQAAFYAFKNFKIPQIGPFAQAPFFTGPWWLWILEVLFLLPLGILTPWYMITLLSFMFIILIFFVGREIGGKWLGALSAFLAAISPAQIDNSFMTWNAAADSILGLLAIFISLKYYKTRKPTSAFLLGFCISLATTIHFQSLLLIPLIIIILIMTKPNIKNLIALAVGGLIPLMPFLYFDLRFNWFETRRIIDYLTIAQYRIYVPNRWLTYAGIYWPENWANISGGEIWISYFIIGLVSLASLLKLKDFSKFRKYYLIAFAFGLSVIMLRYFRGERQSYYTNYAHAYVILFTSWALIQFINYRKIFGIIFISIVVIFTTNASLDNLKPRVITYSQINNLAADIYQNYPDSVFDIYECPFQASLISTAIAYKMYFDGLNSPDGIKIGVCNENFRPSWREVAETEINGPYLYTNKSTPNVYTDMTEWWIKNPPKSLY